MRKWLADIRKEAKRTQQDVADAAGISQAYYAGIELGIRGKPLAVPVAKRIAAVLGLTGHGFTRRTGQGRTAHETPPAGGPGASGTSRAA